MILALAIALAIAPLSLAAAADATAAGTAGAAGAAARTLLTIRGDDPYQRFDGIGGMSTGAQCRLLVDYPEPQRSEILDLLFKPNYGMSSQVLKLEIGGDAQSSDGTEAAFKHYREEPAQCGVNRGYETWMLQEALARNENITSYFLSWGAPNWVGNGSFLSAEGVRFHVDYARCINAQFGHGHPHFMGIWNEWSFTSDFVVALKRELEAAGLGTQLVVADGPNCGPDGELLTNATLRDAVYAVAQHYICRFDGCPNANAAGKAFWASEDFFVSGEDFNGAAYWGSHLSLNWALFNATLTLACSLFWGAYPFYPDSPRGLMSAYSPWSGHYIVGDPIWMTAHHTQFMWPGWHLLQSRGNSSAGSSGVLPGGGSWVAARSPDGADFTLVVETLSAQGDSGFCPPFAPTSAANLTFLLAPGTGLPGPGARLQFWRSVEGAIFEHLPDLVVAADGTVSVDMPHQAKVTISTITTATKGGASAIPPDAPFPLPYSDRFDEADYPEDHVPRFLSDNGGSFAVRRGVLQQVSVADPGPNDWGGCCNVKLAETYLGDDAWTDLSVDVDVSFNSGPPDRGAWSPLPPPPPAAASDPPAVLARVEACDAPGAVRPQQQWAFGAVAEGYLSSAASSPPTCLKLPRCDPDEAFVFAACSAVGPSECGQTGVQGVQALREFQWRLGAYNDAKHALVSPGTDSPAVADADGTAYLRARGVSPDGPGLLWQYNATGTGQLSVSNPDNTSASLCLTAPSSPTPPAPTLVAYVGVLLNMEATHFIGKLFQLRSDATFVVKLSQGPVLARGALAAGFNSSEWHRMTFASKGGALTASVDGQPVWQGSSQGAFPNGAAGLRSGYHYAAFDNLTVSIPA